MMFSRADEETFDALDSNWILCGTSRTKDVTILLQRAQRRHRVNCMTATGAVDILWEQERVTSGTFFFTFVSDEGTAESFEQE